MEELLNKKVLFEENKNDMTNNRYNLREFARLLMMKADLRLKMHEHELALKPLYKLNRLLENKLDSEADFDLKIQYYMMMADLNLSRKEFI